MQEAELERHEVGAGRLEIGVRVIVEPVTADEIVIRGDRDFAQQFRGAAFEAGGEIAEDIGALLGIAGRAGIDEIDAMMDGVAEAGVFDAGQVEECRRIPA
jgi:hypothetical protein